MLLVLDEPSPFGLYVAASQARQLIEQDVGKVSVLVLSPPTDTDAATALEQTAGIDVSWGAALRVSGDDAGSIDVSFEDLAVNKLRRTSYEMLVLCVDVLPPDGLEELAARAGVALGDNRYLDASGDDMAVESGVPGVFVAGCGSGPKTIRDSIAEAKAAADGAVSQLNPLLLEGEAPAASGDSPDATQSSGSEDLRAQLEKLLYALVDR